MAAPFRIRGSARNREQPWHSSPGTRRDECFLRLIRAGHGWFSDRQGTIDLLPGHCLLVTPEDPGLIRADPDDPYDFFRISYGGDYAEQLTRRIIAGRGGRQFRVDDFRACERLCQGIGIITRSAMPTEMGLPEAQLAELLCHLLGEQADDEPLLSKDGLRGHLEEHAAERLTVAGLCRRFAVSQATLTRFCRFHHKRTPQQLIEDVRLELARGLLTIAELDIQEVARRVGYADPFYFSRVFRRRVGEPPREWRRGRTRAGERR